MKHQTNSRDPFTYSRREERTINHEVIRCFAEAILNLRKAAGLSSSTRKANLLSEVDSLLSDLDDFRKGLREWSTAE